MAGARALWRATGMGDDDFGKPIIAIANSFTQFVPGHVHLKDMGQLVARPMDTQKLISSIFEHFLATPNFDLLWSFGTVCDALSTPVRISLPRCLVR